MGTRAAVERRFDQREVSQFDRQAALPEDLLHLPDVTVRTLQSRRGSLFDSPLCLHSLDADFVCRGNPRFFTVDVFVGAILFADLQHFIYPGHLQWIKKHQLGYAVLGKNFGPELDGLLESGKKWKRIIIDFAGNGLSSRMSRQERYPRQDQ